MNECVTALRIWTLNIRMRGDPRGDARAQSRRHLINKEGRSEGEKREKKERVQSEPDNWVKRRRGRSNGSAFLSPGFFLRDKR